MFQIRITSIHAQHHISEQDIFICSANAFGQQHIRQCIGLSTDNGKPPMYFKECTNVIRALPSTTKYFDRGEKEEKSIN